MFDCLTNSNKLQQWTTYKMYMFIKHKSNKIIINIPEEENLLIWKALKVAVLGATLSTPNNILFFLSLSFSPSFFLLCFMTPTLSFVSATRVNITIYGIIELGPICFYFVNCAQFIIKIKRKKRRKQKCTEK